MLAICRAKGARMGLSPTLHRQHMQSRALDRSYRTIYVPSCSFQILGRRSEAFDALAGFRDHLEPGGSLLVSLYVPWREFALEKVWRLRRSAERPGDGATVQVHECTWSDRFEQLLHMVYRLEVWKDGGLAHSELRPHTLRWYHRHEFVLMLERAGFAHVSVEGGSEGRRGSDDDDGWMVVARR